MDDLDAALEAQEQKALVPEPHDALSELMRAMPVTPDRSLAELTPEDRTVFADAYAVLKIVEAAVRDRRRAYELAFRRAAADLDADQIKLTDGVAILKPAKGTYETRAQQMRDELMAQVEAGHISQEELDEAIPVTVEVKPNHTKLNYLARHRGDEVKGAIQSNRVMKEPDPMSAKLEFKRGGK